MNPWLRIWEFGTHSLGLWNMGENDCSNSRLTGHGDIEDAPLEQDMHRIRDLNNSAPLDAANRVKASISRKQYDGIPN